MNNEKKDLRFIEKWIYDDINDINKLNKHINKLMEYKDNYNACVILAKTFYLINNYEQALYYSNEAIKINPNNSAPYYVLFKICVHDYKYIEALEYIKKYRDNNTRKNINIDVYEYLLNENILLEDNMTTKDKIMSNSLHCNIDEEYRLRKQYDRLIDFLNDKNYIKAKECIETLNEICSNHFLNIDFKVHEYLINDIIYILKEKKVYDSEGIYNLDKIKFKNAMIDTNKIYKDIIMFINEGKFGYANDFKLFLKEITNEKNFEIYSKLISNIERGKKRFYKLSNNAKSLSLYYQREGENAIQNYEFEDAIRYFSEGLESTGNFEFNFYIGKALFKNQQSTEAIEFLEKYLNNSGNLYQIALYYLGLSYKCSKQYDKVIQIKKELLAVNKLLGIKKDLHVLDGEYKRYESPNSKPKRLLKEIKFTEDDFKK